MARNPELIKRRNAKMVARYEALRAVRVGRTRKYTASFVISKLAEEFDLSERTVEDIVWKARD